jgi:aspartyl/asparaginyl-tRNA synthetase
MEHTSIKQALDNESLTGTTVTVAGWVRTFRNDRFIALNDGSTIRNLQCVIDQEKVDATQRAHASPQVPQLNAPAYWSKAKAADNAWRCK